MLLLFAVCCCCHPSRTFVLQLERVRAAQGETAMQQCGAGFYFTDSATTRYVILALPKSGG
jgi:hypothetical protein